MVVNYAIPTSRRNLRRDGLSKPVRKDGDVYDTTDRTDSAADARTSSTGNPNFFLVRDDYGGVGEKDRPIPSRNNPTLP